MAAVLWCGIADLPSRFAEAVWGRVQDLTPCLAVEGNERKRGTPPLQNSIFGRPPDKTTKQDDAHGASE